MLTKEELIKECETILDQIESITNIRYDMLDSLIKIGKYKEFRKIFEDIAKKFIELEYEIGEYKDDLYLSEKE